MTIEKSHFAGVSHNGKTFVIENKKDMEITTGICFEMPETFKKNSMKWKHKQGFVVNVGKKE